MKVTFCAHDYANVTGGPLVWLLRLLPELKRRGVSPKVLFMAEDLSKTPHMKALSAAGIDTLGTTFPQSTEQRVRWYLQQVIDDPPDVFVPSHIPAAYYAAGWIRAAGIPTVGVLHSDDEFYHGLLSELVFGSEFFKLSGLVCVSDFLAQQVLLRNPKNFFVERIPCGVPLVEGVATWSDDVLKLVYAGRLVEEQKRISATVRALCRVVKEIAGVEAVMYGEGTGRQDVERILAAEGEDISKWLPGLIPNDQIQSRLLEQHVFVLLSDYEGLPIALMEAMACGVVPVCLETKSGIPELVKNNVNGIIVADRGDSFVAAIRRIKEEKGYWQRLSIAAKHTIKEEFSSPVAADKWRDLFLKLKSESPQRNDIKMPREMKLPHAHPGLDAMFSPDLSSRRAVLLFHCGRFLKQIFRRLSYTGQR